MQDTYLPVCRFIRYIIDILVYLYHVSMLISVSISVSIHSVSSIAYRGKRKNIAANNVVAELGLT